jgi:hypothetical protein
MEEAVLIFDEGKKVGTILLETNYSNRGVMSVIECNFDGEELDILHILDMSYGIVIPKHIADIIRNTVNKQDDAGCEYCNNAIPICNRNRNEIGIELHSGSGHLIAYGKDHYGWDISVSTKIKYCPMCGREFK